jgi:hypothetical protein
VQTDTSIKSGYIDVALDPGSKYQYRVKVADTLGNVGAPTPVLTSQPGTVPNITAKPDIVVNNWTQQFGVVATISWNTDQLADSFVAYSKEPLQTGASTLTVNGNPAQVVGQFDKSFAHVVRLQQLDPSTVYYFKTLSQNEIKITGASDVVRVLTPERIPLVISGFKFEKVTPISAQVSWHTNKLSTSVLNYGPSSSYGKSITDDNLNTDHVMDLTGLAPGSTVNAQIVGSDSDKNTSNSDNYVLSVPALPLISGVRISDATATTATITWATNVNTDSNVSFGENDAAISQQGKSDSTELHSVTVIGLKAATTYKYKVTGKDGFGNVATSGESTFATPEDKIAAIISGIRVQVIEDANNVDASGTPSTQAIVLWDTDKPTTHHLEYGIGSGETFTNKTPDVITFNQTHTVILPDLRPNTSYSAVVVDVDAAGNSSRSAVFTIVTPPVQQSLLKLLGDQLAHTFAWVGRINLFHRK